METTTLVGAGHLARPEAETDLNTLPWHAHPRFAGVALRHLVTGAETGGALSAHLVRIEAGCCLESHVHEASLELHEVVRGAGNCDLSGRLVAYAPGVCGLIPAGTRHAVQAAAEGDLYILAKFVPALV
jgi:quercetin dioxygenase-like cupin family protein